jgi:seryl-tRNA synthetase
MLSIQYIRQNPDAVRQSLSKRGEDTDIREVIRLDEEWRRLLQEVEGLRAKRKQASKEIGQMKEKPAELLAEMRDAGEMVKSLEDEISRNEEALNDLLLRIPNLVHPDVPVGKDESDNVVVRTWGEIGISGSRFYVLRGPGAKLQRALITFMLDLHVGEHGYSEVYPPFMVKQEAMLGSGNLPKFADNLYHDAEDDLWFVPTAEVPLTNLHRDEILEPGSLPLYYVAYTACFRREQMSAGKDTRGIKRGHQFDKVELYKFVEPETSDRELDMMVADATGVCEKLGLPYRILQLCSGDLGFNATKSYDIEVWAAGCGEWLEVSSCSNCSDFQARRSNVRYRTASGEKPQHPHTLNGSGLALPRILIAVLENYQQPDGTVVVPEALRPYMGVDLIG